MKPELLTYASVKLSIFFSIAFCSILLCSTGAAADAVSGEYIVKFKPGASGQPTARIDFNRWINTFLKDFGFEPKRKLTSSDTRVVKAKTKAQLRSLKRLRKSSAVQYVVKNYRRKAFVNPNEFFYTLGLLWGLNNTGQSKGTNDVDIDAPEAWSITTGSEDIVVAVIDSGIDYTHSDLQPNMWRNTGEKPGNGIDDDGNGVVDDYYGYNAYSKNGNPRDDYLHGTHVAGIIGARGNNNIGVTGINWKIKMMAVKMLGAKGDATDAEAIEAIDYVIKMKRRGVNIRIINASWGGPDTSAALEDAVARATAAGILVIAAAGNDGTDNDSKPMYPANYRRQGVLSVAAIDRNGNLADFSNYGNSTVDLAAPGVGIWSTVPFFYLPLDGTSMAAPHVAGVAALALSKNPNHSPASLREHLVSTAKQLRTLNNLLIKPGVVNAYNAVSN